MKKFFIFIIYSTLLLSCRKKENDYSELIEEATELLEEGKNLEAINKIESEPYEAIKNSEVSFLLAQSYCIESKLGKSFLNSLFSDFENQFTISNISNLNSINANLPAYNSKNLLNLKKCLSSFFRSRHDKDGFALINFDENQIVNFLREITTRTIYLVAQIKEFIELCEIFSYFFTDHNNTKTISNASLSLFTRIIEDIASTHEDLMEQTKLFPDPILEQIAKIITQNPATLTMRKRNYKLSWTNHFKEGLYRIVKNSLTRKDSNATDLLLDIQSIQKIAQDSKGKKKLENYFVDTIIDDKLKNSDPNKKSQIFQTAIKIIQQRQKNIKQTNSSPQDTQKIKNELARLIKSL